MELALTWRGDYVVRAAVELARRHISGDWQKASDLARVTRIPEGYIRQILRMLVQNGIADAHAGSTGGYRLRRTPDEISLLDVIEIAEGPLMNRRCVMKGTGCSPKRPCVFHPVLFRAQEALRHELRNSTLQTIIA